MNEIIIVEQGRVNWKGEYCIVTFCPVDSIKTGELLLRNANKEWKRSNFKVKKLDKNVYEARRKCKYTGDEIYFMRIRTMYPRTTEDVKEQIKLREEELNTPKFNPVINFTID